MTSTPNCSDEVSVALTGRDLWVLRLGLKTLLAASTRHEHVYHDIHAALAKIPEGHEPGGDACACVPRDAADPSGGRGEDARRVER